MHAWSQTDLLDAVPATLVKMDVQQAISWPLVQLLVMFTFQKTISTVRKVNSGLALIRPRRSRAVVNTMLATEVAPWAAVL